MISASLPKSSSKALHVTHDLILVRKDLPKEGAITKYPHSISSLFSNAVLRDGLLLVSPVDLPVHLRAASFDCVGRY